MESVEFSGFTIQSCGFLGACTRWAGTWMASRACLLALLILGNTPRVRAQAMFPGGGKTVSVDADSNWAPSKLGAPLLRDPIWVYNNWSAFDELGDNISLNEELAMRELEQIGRLKKLAVHFDYYMMDAFWFAEDGAYRTFCSPDWPHGIAPA